MKNTNRNFYINPYLGGVFIGLLIVVAYYFSGEGLGSSGGFRDMAIGAIDTVAPNYAENNAFVSPHVGDGKSPTHTWLVYELLGVIFGAILSAAIFGRLKFTIGKAPHITNKKRLIYALIGGLIWGVGASLGRGCTSGLVMSGIAVNSLSGYIGLVGIFGFGFIFAYIFKGIWIKKIK
ncbi:MAG TPA: hypothetical protein EYG92_09495 [Lutibacter sp.]|nr:hypothetical protein [Lutibacter sp.]